jgi:ribosomal-protein-serine acetyltransferase
MAEYMLGIEVDDEIFLRLREARYADDMFRVVQANRARLGQWFWWVDVTRTSQDVRRHITETLRAMAEGKEYAFDLLHRGELVGSVGLRVDSAISEAEFGYWISSAAEGRGIVTRAARTLLRFAFEELEMNRILIKCAADNARSQAVARRLGFREEGTLRERDVVPGRDRRDEVFFGLLRSEWDDAQSLGE